MITYLKRHEINDAKWNTSLANCSNALIYATTTYLDIVCPDWEALVMDDYNAIMPLTQRSKGSFHYLFQPFFAQQLGVFGNNITDQLVAEFINAIPTPFKFIEINLNSANKQPQLNDFKISERVNYELNLKQPFEVLIKNFSENLIRNYKKAVKNELSIIRNVSVEEFITFCEKHSRNMAHRKTLIVLVEQIAKKAAEQGIVELVGVADKDKKMCSANLFLTGFNRTINLFPVSNERGTKNGAMVFLLFNQIMQLSGADTVFDFEGSMLSGVARFYASFGSEAKTYYHIRRNRLPWYIKWLKSE